MSQNSRHASFLFPSVALALAPFACRAGFLTGEPHLQGVGTLALGPGKFSNPAGVGVPGGGRIVMADDGPGAFLAVSPVGVFPG